MDVKEKLLARYKLAIAIQKIILNNVARNEEDLVTSLRKLAASSETEYSIIQKISSGKKDPQFTTLAAIVDGFGISLSEFSKVFDSVSKEDIDRYKSSLKEKSEQPQSSLRKAKVVKKKSVKKKQ